MSNLAKEKDNKPKKLSPAMTHYQQIKAQYPDCIIFYRLGDFYEMFDTDAITVSKELDLTLTGKDCGLGERMPMCGVPFHAYEQYAQKLIERGYKVAICEQLTEPTKGKLVERDVVRVITPGTVIDTSMLNESANTYMLCIYVSGKTISYAYSDMSTGEIGTASYTGDNLKNYINDQIVRIMPSEIICNHDALEICENLPCRANNKYKFNEYYNWAFSQSNAERNILNQYNLTSLTGFDFATPSTIIAIGALLEYFYETQKRELKHLRLPKLINDKQFMYVDTNTRRNLEIEMTLTDGTKYGSLLWVIDKTCTSGGARMLRNWIRQPLQDKAQIDARLNLVDTIYKNPILRSGLKECLDRVQDIERYVGKISYGNITPKDCIALSSSLKQTPRIKQLLAACNPTLFADLIGGLADTTQISNLIDCTIKDEPPTIIKDGGYIKEGFNPQLDYFNGLKKNAEQTILNMQASEREKTGIKNLKIGYNRVFGYYIEVNKQFSNIVPFSYIRRQTISNNERYITEELKKFEEDVISSTEKALRLEEEIFAELKRQLLANTTVMQQIAIALSTIDCIYSLATVAVENEYVKPTITNDKQINIVAGRHPIVEKVIKGGDFISNDCKLNDDDQRTIILTGPNMAGKSTYMRQVALITYLAHIGSFVPAKSAEICIVDRIFTRIGASDNLAVGQSTFMVEMIEVANILNYCTDNSLIILDEVGRGTSTFDGLSIAWAVVEYLTKHRNTKTLFATHYHELMQLEGMYPGVKNYCISIKEIGGKLVFLRKIMRGSATRSYGVEVASLAGLPSEIISRAKTLITEFEAEKISSTAQKESEILDIIKNIDINKLSPLESFETLARLIELAK